MDNPFSIIYLFLALFIFGLYAQNAHSYQNLAIAAGEPDFFRNPVTNFNSVRFSANDPIYDPATRTVTTTRPYNVTGLDGKVYQATITKTAAADIPKVGAALSKFAQRIGPVSMALATTDLICSLTTICAVAGAWLYGENITTVTGTSLTCAMVGTGTVQYLSSGFYHRYKLIPKPNCGGVTPSGWGVVASCASVHSCPWGDDMIKENAGSAVAYPSQTPATPSDWTNAETALSTPAGADRLAAELEPLPVQVPSVFSPISVPLGTSTATNKDALGNATGTQQTTRRLDIEDAATEAEPCRVTVKETDTVTNYDLNNSPISSTETVTQSDTPAEPPPPEDIEIDFDESVDRDLQTFEVPGIFSYTPFGGAGSCPADISENTKFGNVTMSYRPICDVAEGVRPFVILLAIISAFFIVSGSRQS